MAKFKKSCYRFPLCLICSIFHKSDIEMYIQIITADKCHLKKTNHLMAMFFTEKKNVKAEEQQY